MINGKQPGNTRLGGEAHSAAEAIFTAEGMPITILQSEICSRQTFAEAPAVGKAVVDYAPSSKASKEIQQLAKEVLECLSQVTAGA